VLLNGLLLVVLSLNDVRVCMFDVDDIVGDRDGICCVDVGVGVDVDVLVSYVEGSYVGGVWCSDIVDGDVGECDGDGVVVYVVVSVLL